MWQKLKSGGADVRAAFDSMPFIFDNESELLRRYIFGKSVDNELVAGAILENVLLNQFNWPATENSQKGMRFFRKLVSRFTVGEIKEIFEALKDKNFDERSKILVEKLEGKNIKWPKDEKEVDDFLAETK